MWVCLNSVNDVYMYLLRKLLGQKDICAVDLEAFPEENETSARTAQRLVGSCCHNITILERIIAFLHVKE